MDKLEVFLKEDENRITIRETTYLEFPFFIESDNQGHSEITLEDGKLYDRNYHHREIISNKQISRKKAREIIKETWGLRHP